MLWWLRKAEAYPLVCQAFSQPSRAQEISDQGPETCDLYPAADRREKSLHDCGMLASVIIQSSDGPMSPWLALALLVCVACGGSRPPEDRLKMLESSLPDEVGGWRAVGVATYYDAESIYSYIDGLAEVYIAYGMRRCLARRYQGPEGEADVFVDIFEMASPEDAFGVSTHDRDGEAADVGNDGLIRYGWLSFWKGPFFVSIYAENESAASREAVMELGRVVDNALPESGVRPAIVDRLPRSGLDQRSVRFLRSHQILNNNVYISEENLLRLGPDVSAALGRYRRNGAAGHLLVVEYRADAESQAALQSFADGRLGGLPDEPVEVQGEGWFAVGRNGNRIVAVLAADTRELAESLLRAGEEESP